jgi:hypothetical protein
VRIRHGQVESLAINAIRQQVDGPAKFRVDAVKVVHKAAGFVALNPSFVFRIDLARRLLDGFGVDFEFDLFTYGHCACFQKFIVIDSVILAVQFGFRLQPDAHSASRVFGGLRHFRW